MTIYQLTAACKETTCGFSDHCVSRRVFRTRAAAEAYAEAWVATLCDLAQLVAYVAAYATARVTELDLEDPHDD